MDKSLPYRALDVLDCTSTYWLLKLTDLLGWSVLANHRLRPSILRMAGFDIGEHCHVHPGIVIHSHKHEIHIGAHTFVNKGCLFDAASAPIHIGSHCEIGFNVSFLNVDHQIGLAAHGRRPFRSKGPMRIGDNVWVGANVTFLPGVTVGDGTIVAAGAVVTKDVPPHTLVAGVPARVLRELDNSSYYVADRLQA